MAGLADILSGINPEVLLAAGSGLLSAPRGERLGTSLGRATLLGLSQHERSKRAEAAKEQQEYLKAFRKFQLKRMQDDQQRAASRDAYLHSLTGLGSGGGAMPPAGPMATGQFGMQDVLRGMQAGATPQDLNMLASMGQQQGPEMAGSIGGFLAQELQQRRADAIARGNQDEAQYWEQQMVAAYNKPSDIELLTRAQMGRAGMPMPSTNYLDPYPGQQAAQPASSVQDSAINAAIEQPPPAPTVQTAAPDDPGFMDQAKGFLSDLFGGDGAEQAAAPGSLNSRREALKSIIAATSPNDAKQAVRAARAAGIPDEQLQIAVKQSGFKWEQVGGN